MKPRHYPTSNSKLGAGFKIKTHISNNKIILVVFTWVFNLPARWSLWTVKSSLSALQIVHTRTFCFILEMGYSQQTSQCIKMNILWVQKVKTNFVPLEACDRQILTCSISFIVWKGEATACSQHFISAHTCDRKSRVLHPEAGRCTIIWTMAR